MYCYLEDSIWELQREYQAWTAILCIPLFSCVPQMNLYIYSYCYVIKLSSVTASIFPRSNTKRSELIFFSDSCFAPIIFQIEPQVLIICTLQTQNSSKIANNQKNIITPKQMYNNNNKNNFPPKKNKQKRDYHLISVLFFSKKVKKKYINWTMLFIFRALFI